MNTTHPPPCPAERNTAPTVESEMLERRVCPNCRNYWDASPNSDTWFCSIACRKRHERGFYYG